MSGPHAGRSALAAAATLLAFCSGAATAATSVTVYTRDLGFVRKARVLQLVGARDTVRLADIPERIDFSSVRLDPGGTRVVRLAYRYDVSNGDALLDNARGSQIRLTLRGERVVEGALVISDGSWIVVRDADGKLHTVPRGSVDDVRLGDAPSRIATRPALETVLEGARGGRVMAELAYLTGGLSWTAEHSVVRTGENGASWSTAVSVENTTGRDFLDVDLKLVAGEPRREAGSPAPLAPRMAMMTMGAEAKGADLSEQTFSEYHLYTLGRPATLRDRETQKFTMLEPRAVKVTPRYLFRAAEGRGVRTQMEFRNTAAAGLGVPLPAGRVRFYEKDAAGDLQFTGETHIAHTPEGEKLTLDVGQAFDLVAERRELFNRRVSDREREYGVEIKLRNQKKSDATIVVEESAGGDVEVTQQSHPFTRKDANTLQFDVPVAAGKEAVVSYTAHVRY